MLAAVAAAAAAQAAASPYGECQPKVGVHAHQPQYHVIAPQFPGKNGATWPGGVNDANAVFGRSGVFHIFHQCDGGPSGVPCGGGWEGANPHPTPAESKWFHSWGHVISKNLATWQRLPDALTPNLTNYEHGEACDGSISFPESLCMWARARTLQNVGPIIGRQPPPSGPHGIFPFVSCASTLSAATH
eukprot:COSAG03_NODE_3920_length_1759_cov_2.032530_4_plen_187_part_01